MIHEFHYAYIKNKYGHNARLLLTDTDSLMHRTKTEDIYEDFSKNKEILDFSNYSTWLKYFDDLTKFVVGKIKDEAVCVATEEFVGWKPKMYSFIVDDSSVSKMAKGVNRIATAAISDNKFENVLLNYQCLRHSINRIGSKNLRKRP